MTLYHARPTRTPDRLPIWVAVFVVAAVVVLAGCSPKPSHSELTAVLERGNAGLRAAIEEVECWNRMRVKACFSVYRREELNQP